jgi:enamine deaminase RidA (YjgF/YER057c/UK114 family)
MPTQFLNPPGLAPTNGWTHVVTSTGGKTIHVSGQVSVDDRGQVVGKGDLKAQTEPTFANLEVALKAAGASFRDVVKMNLYVVDLKPEIVPLLREVRARYVNRESPPASTLVGVTALVDADWLIEIEVVAVVTASAACPREATARRNPYPRRLQERCAATSQVKNEPIRPGRLFPVSLVPDAGVLMNFLSMLCSPPCAQEQVAP